MKEFFFETPIRDSKPLYKQEDLEKVRELYKEFDGQNLEWVVRTPEEIRRLKANRYYWGGVLTEFIPAIYQTVMEAHEHFTKKYLSKVDVLDLNESDFEKELSKIVRLSSRSRNTLKWEKVSENTVRISWIQSTSTLSKKGFASYINDVIRDGQTENGLEFKPIEQFNEYK